MYRLFHDGEAPTTCAAETPKMTNRKQMARQADYLSKLRRLLAKWNLTTRISCCTWLKESQEASPVRIRRCVMSVRK